MSSSEIIYLLRHGQTEWNRDGILQGHMDSPLTETGRLQMEAIGHYLLGILPNRVDVHVECSPLGRAKASAAIIQEMVGLHSKQMTYSELLAEIHLGEWQGLDNKQIEARWPGMLAQRQQDKWYFKIPGGENYAMLAQRARIWLVQKRLAPITVVITHQQLSNSLRGQYLGLLPAEILQLSHEQRCLFCLQNGTVERYTIRGMALDCHYQAGLSLLC